MRFLDRSDRHVALGPTSQIVFVSTVSPSPIRGRRDRCRQFSYHADRHLDFPREFERRGSYPYRRFPLDAARSSWRPQYPALPNSYSLQMGTWALAAFYNQANNRLRLLFPLREPSVFSLDRGACAPFKSPSGYWPDRACNVGEEGRSGASHRAGSPKFVRRAREQALHRGTDRGWLCHSRQGQRTGRRVRLRGRCGGPFG